MTGQPEAVEPAGEGQEDRAWWDDPAMPWRHEPARADLVCMAALGIVAVYGLVMLPLRPAILGLAPQVHGSLGYRTGVVMSGALAAVGDRWWPLVGVLASLMTVKFSWIYWWAGRLWGRNIMDVWANGKSPRTARRWQRVWDLTHRYEAWAIVATFLPLPIPSGVVYAALGAAGTRLRTFLTVTVASSAVTTGLYLWLGYSIGEPAVVIIDTYGRYLWYFSIVLVAGMIGAAVLRQRRSNRADA